MVPDLLEVINHHKVPTVVCSYSFLFSNKTYWSDPLWSSTGGGSSGGLRVRAFGEPRVGHVREELTKINHRKVILFDSGTQTVQTSQDTKEIVQWFGPLLKPLETWTPNTVFTPTTAPKGLNANRRFHPHQNPWGFNTSMIYIFSSWWKFTFKMSLFTNLMSLFLFFFWNCDNSIFSMWLTAVLNEDTFRDDDFWFCVRVCPNQQWILYKVLPV